MKKNKNKTTDKKAHEDKLTGEPSETKEEDMPDDTPPDDEPAPNEESSDEESSFGAMSKMGIFALFLIGIVIPLSSLIGANAQSVPAGNLIANPNLETEIAVPAMWNRGGYGENIASFSYPTMGGASVSHAVRIDMTERVTGDAKWYPDDVPVKPSTKYVFSDTSSSNVSTPIDIRYKVINRALERLGTGSKYRYRYVKLGDVPAQSTPTVRQFEFITPPNAVSLTIFHSIDRVGYLVTDNYSLMEAGATGTTTLDMTAPLVSITAPLNNGTVSGTTTVSANATDNVGVAGISLMLDGVMIGTEDTVAPYSFEWNTMSTSNGAHTLTAKARDAAGNIGTSTAISVTVNNAAPVADTAAPSASITSPLDGAAISGTVTISVNASDNVGIAGVRVVHSGTNHSDIPIGAEDTAAPYSFEWNTIGVADGVHMLTAHARDAAGNIATSSTISVTINNAASTTDTTVPTISVASPQNGATVSGTTTVSVTSADNVAVVSNTLFVDGAAAYSLGTTSPATFDWNTMPLADGVHTLYAVAKDAAENTATSSAVSVTVQNETADTMAPTVSVTSPIAGTTIYATTTVSMNAADNVGIAGVSLLLDGVMIMTEDTVAPYSFEWNTANATNGNHAIAGQARDAAGNLATSSAVLINVSNN